MDKKRIIILIILVLISGCSKNNKQINNNNQNNEHPVYDENSANEIEVVTENDITVTGTKIITTGDHKILKSKIINNKKVGCDSVTISILDENGDLIKELNLSTNGLIEVDEIILIDIDYTFEEKNPTSFKIRYNETNNKPVDNPKE